MKKIIILVVILVLLGAFVGATLTWDIIRYANHPLSDSYDEKEVIIPPNQRFNAVLSNLSQSGLNISVFKFKCIARAKGYDKNIKAGEYLIPANMSPLEIFDILVNGKERLYRITIPEGYTIAQIADLIAQSGWDIKNAFLDLTRDPEFIKTLEIDAPTLEGYLFPDTYYFPKNVTAEKMIAYMVAHFKTVFSPVWHKRAEALGWSIHQTVTMASIIEKETGAAEERPVISSVFHNRLKKGMRLESDPTVIYGIENFDGNITRKHLVTTTPYNTYRINGLPPGPIANPGKEAIEAALYPAETRLFVFCFQKKQYPSFFHRYQCPSSCRKKIPVAQIDIRIVALRSLIGKKGDRQHPVQPDVLVSEES